MTELELLEAIAGEEVTWERRHWRYRYWQLGDERDTDATRRVRELHGDLLAHEPGNANPHRGTLRLSAVGADRMRRLRSDAR